ncbi:MAG: hypothetical protein Q4B65_02690 [Candidatus Saccharibacteria bacterium]|nr:hypothetical protein [Candidatus Saccharibacteria bacterium]
MGTFKLWILLGPVAILTAFISGWRAIQYNHCKFSTDRYSEELRMGVDLFLAVGMMVALLLDYGSDLIRIAEEDKLIAFCYSLIAGIILFGLFYVINIIGYKLKEWLTDHRMWKRRDKCEENIKNALNCPFCGRECPLEELSFELVVVDKAGEDELKASVNKHATFNLCCCYKVKNSRTDIYGFATELKGKGSEPSRFVPLGSCVRDKSNYPDSEEEPVEAISSEAAANAEIPEES